MATVVDKVGCGDGAVRGDLVGVGSVGGCSATSATSQQDEERKERREGMRALESK